AFERLVERFTFACRHPNLCKLSKKLCSVIVTGLFLGKKWLREAVPFVRHSYLGGRGQFTPAFVFKRLHITRKLEAFPSSLICRARASVASGQAFKLFL